MAETILELKERVAELEAELKAERGAQKITLAGLTTVNGYPIPAITIRPADQN